MGSNNSDREQAIENTRQVIQSPMCMMSRSMREDALRDARSYKLTVEELIEYLHARQKARE